MGDPKLGRGIGTRNQCQEAQGYEQHIFRRLMQIRERLRFRSLHTSRTTRINPHISPLPARIVKPTASDLLCEIDGLILAASGYRRFDIGTFAHLAVARGIWRPEEYLRVVDLR